MHVLEIEFLESPANVRRVAASCDQFGSALPVFREQVTRRSGRVGINMVRLKTLCSQASYVIKLAKEWDGSIFRVGYQVYIRRRISMDRSNLVHRIVERLGVVEEMPGDFASILPECNHLLHGNQCGRHDGRINIATFIQERSCDLAASGMASQNKP